jgi:hypothetical protein
MGAAIEILPFQVSIIRRTIHFPPYGGNGSGSIRTFGMGVKVLTGLHASQLSGLCLMHAPNTVQKINCRNGLRSGADRRPARSAVIAVLGA